VDCGCTDMNRCPHRTSISSMKGLGTSNIVTTSSGIRMNEYTTTGEPPISYIPTFG